MISRDDLTQIVACSLLPGAPELIQEAAGMVADAILAEYAVVKLPESSHIDEHGTSWHGVDGRVLARVANETIWAADDLLDADDAVEEASALLAAARSARLFEARR